MFTTNYRIHPRLNWSYLKIRIGLQAFLLVILLLAFAVDLIESSSIVQISDPIINSSLAQEMVYSIPAFK